MELIRAYLPFLIPLFLLQLGAQILSVINLFKRDTRVRWGNKIIWCAIIVLLELFGVLAYFLIGRLPSTGEDQ